MNSSESDAPSATFWRRVSPAEHPIPWLAVCGAVLVLVAAVTSTTARWADVPIVARLGGMLFLHACIVAFAERWRRTLPSTSRIPAHLGAALFTPTAISVVASLHGSWRSCIFVGGIVGVAALEAQGRRWSARLIHAAEVAAVCTGAAGGAAITHAPLGALLGGASICALIIGWERRAAALAAFAVATPILAVMARLRIGPGTIAELGATGSILRWGAPSAGLLSATVFATLATRHSTRRIALLGASATSLVASVGISATFVDVPGYAWACIPGLLLIAAQCLFRTRMFEGPSHRVIGEALEITELLAAFGIAGAVGTSRPSVPLVVLAAGWAIGALRNDRTLLPELVPAATATLTAGLAAAFELGTFWPVVWTGLGLAGAIATARRDRTLGMFVGCVAPIVLIGQLADAGVGRTTTSALMIAIGVAAMGCAAAIRRGITPLDALAAVALTGGALLIPSDLTRCTALALVGLATIAVGVVHRHRLLTVAGLLQLGAGAFGVFNTVHFTAQHRLDVLVAATVAMTVAIEWWTRRHEGWTGPRYAVASIVGGGYLLASLIGDHTSTRLATALVLGLVAIAFGSVTRIAATTVTGTGVVAATLVVATRRELTSMPTWAWMLLGGFALLGLAIGLERNKAQRAR